MVILSDYFCGEIGEVLLALRFSCLAATMDVFWWNMQSSTGEPKVPGKWPGHPQRNFRRELAESGLSRYKIYFEQEITCQTFSFLRERDP